MYLFLFRHSVETDRKNDLTRNSSENTHPQSSQLVEPVWIDPRFKRVDWCARADLPLIKKIKKERKGGWKMIRRTFPIISRMRVKKKKKKHHTYLVRVYIPSLASGFLFTFSISYLFLSMSVLLAASPSVSCIRQAVVFLHVLASVRRELT